MATVDERLKEWATPRQAEIIDAVNEHGSYRKAAVALDCAQSLIGQAVTAVRKKAAAEGYLPDPTPAECLAALSAWEFCGRDARTAADRLEIGFGEFSRRLMIAQERARQAAMAPNTTDGFIVREVTKAYDSEGEVSSEWVREGPAPNQAPGGEDAGPARDGGDGYLIKGVSTLFDGAGNVRGQWVKTHIDLQHWMESVRRGVDAFIADVEPIAPADAPTDYDTDIIPWIQIGDAHLGMLAHEAETGQNFDLKIAERELKAAISLLIDETGAHERCVINDLGDFTHYENFQGKTEASGHDLDFDGRFPRMIEVYSRVMRFIVDKALSKFRYVDVIINQGNHSRTNDIWMAELLRVAYEPTGRVNVLNNATAFIAYRMGKTFVLVHHSDKCKPDQLVKVMSVDFQHDWGETDYHYVDIGHIHHKLTSKEHPGAVVESWNILAPMDKYAHDAGYRMRQSVTVVDRSRRYGEVARRKLPIERVRDAIRAALPLGEKIYQAQPKKAFAV